MSNYNPQNEKLYTSNAWLITFADLLSLLLVFFIMLYATSNLKSGQWDSIKSSIGRAFKANSIIDEYTFSSSLGVSKVDVTIGVDLDYLFPVLEQRIKEDRFLSGKVIVKSFDEKIVISMKKETLFIDNTVNFRNDADLIMMVLGDNLQRVKNKMDIVSFIEADRSSIEKNSENWRAALMQNIKIASKLREYGNLSKIESSVSFESDHNISIEDESKYDSGYSTPRVQYPKDYINIIISRYSKDF